MMMNKQTAPTPYLVQFVLFNLCFFALQLILIYSEAGNFVSLIPLPWRVYEELILTFVLQLSLYLLLSLAQTFLLLGVVKRNWLSHWSPERWLVSIWVVSLCAILSANAYYFPLSLFSKLLSPPLTELSALILLCSSLIVLIVLALNTLMHYQRLMKLLVVAVPVLLVLSFYPKPSPLQATLSKPNVIILGIDSLSPERVNPQQMPNLSRLLAQSTLFTNSISPLARTYPAWSSILTGLYVKHHHASENLITKTTVNSKASMVWAFNARGYRTLYATDDRRFNGIDKDFGFQKVIGPKLGINEVLLGTYNDFPLGNLLINFRLTRALFPYNYANRASYFSYYPETFSQQLGSELNQESLTKPLFLAIHFTLPHWPYAWAQSRAEDVNNEFSLTDRADLYEQALKKVDQQLAAVHALLQKQQLLNNALLIILSDHGEVLYSANTRLTNRMNYQGNGPSQLEHYFNKHTATDLDKSAGHGSDLLSPKQYQTVLAFTIYQQGKVRTAATSINTRVALLDIAPTVFDFIHWPHPQMDGISLLPTLLNPTLNVAQRTFFMESGMFPNQAISKQKAIRIGQRFYQVNPHSDELELSQQGMNNIAQQKLYGVIQDDWILVVYPDKKSNISVIQNLSSGKWSDDLNSPFAKASPAGQLSHQLNEFYK